MKTCISIVAFSITLLVFQVVAAQTPVEIDPQIQRAQFEPSFAVNPTNPKNMVGGVITVIGARIDVYYTKDGGQSWTLVSDLSQVEGAGADPMVAFDGDGIAYLTYQISTLQQILIRKSTDGGASWSGPSTVYDFGGRVDRPWLGISPVRNAYLKFDIFVSFKLAETGYPNAA